MGIKKRDFFHADASRDVYAEFPDPDAIPGMCAKLSKSLYGARDAPQNWEEE